MTITRFSRFLATGAFGASCYIAGSYTLTVLGIDAWLASFSVYVCLAPIIYMMQRTFVFKSNLSHQKSFPRYIIIQLLGICFSAIIPYIFKTLGAGTTLSFFCVAAVIALTNYILQLNWAFSVRAKMGKKIEAD